jgi:hypothetical protein
MDEALVSQKSQEFSAARATYLVNAKDGLRVFKGRNWVSTGHGTLVVVRGQVDQRREHGFAMNGAPELRLFDVVGFNMFDVLCVVDAFGYLFLDDRSRSCRVASSALILRTFAVSSTIESTSEVTGAWGAKSCTRSFESENPALAREDLHSR